MAKKKKLDTAWGIERSPHALNVGSIVVGGPDQAPIFLWSEPVAKINAKNMTGALRHGDRVEVLANTKIDDRRYYYVRRDEWHDGKRYRQEGWLSALLLKKRGEDGYERTRE